MLKIIAELTSPKSKHRKSLGFTLIEVLVTISIIGMLSSVASVSAKSARVNARDTRRIQEVENIQKAIELYYADNGTYPFLGVSADPTVNIAYRSHSGSWNDLAARLNPYTKILNVSPA